MPCWCAGKCPHVGRAQSFVNRKNIQRARMALRNSLSVAPLCVEGNIMLANLLSQHNQAHAAMAHIDRAAINMTDQARLHFERGKVFRAEVKLPEAREEFYKALQLAPDNPNIASALVGALEMADLLKEAATVCQAARVKFPDHADLRRLQAAIADGMKDPAGAAEILHAGMVADPTNISLLPVELLDRGRYLEKLGDYAGAWESWDRGKTMLREKFGHIYKRAFFEKQFAGLREAATAPRHNFVRRAPPLETDPAPLFICGYPRSGTTLAETILSSHSAVVAGDELMGVTNVIEAMPAWLKVRLPYPACMVSSSLGENAAIPELLRDLYMKSAQERIGFHNRRAPPRTGLGKATRGKPFFFTDKMPLNELHLPLIRMLFPAAPIFRMQRHPLDVMVSCMSNWLVHGGYYASSLEVAASHYRAVDDVIQHYERQFAIESRLGMESRRSMVTVRLESLIADQEKTTTDMLAGAGLALERACLAFHKAKRTARTLSYRQVRQPLNAAGVGRWRNFREQLAPAVEILRPILEREGYDF